MQTSLNEIKLIDEHLLHKESADNKLLFDAMLIIDPELNEKVLWQKMTHAIIKSYSRKKLIAEIEAVHHQLFTQPAHQSFRAKILSLFN